MPIPRYKILILFSIFVDYPVYALEEFTLCRPYADLAPARPNLPLVTDEAIRVFADSTTMHEKQGIASFSGNVLLQRADQILSTPAIIYERNRDIVEADNDFTFWDKNFVISGKRLQLRPQHQGTLEDTTYWLLNRRGRGTAKKIIQENQDIVHLEQSSYTTCDPDNEMWRLNVHDLTLDNATATGTAYHVTVRFLNMPLFYMPYLSFPLDKERRSGFLPPSAGSSDEVGFEMSIPYYWNIAPNYDATLTPRFMTKRGILLKTEFRYLTVANGGTVTMEYLPNDRVSDENRSSFAFIHNGALTDRLTTDINFNYASDERYFEELGNNLSMASTTHLERRADLVYRGDGWDVLGRLQAFQTLDRNPASRPYKRFPQLVFKTTFPERNRQLNTESTVELVRFDRDTDMTTGPVGERLDVNTSASWPWRTPGAFFVPKLSLLYTRYTLDNQKDELANNPSRALFRITADSGLFFERNTDFLNTALLQTLEPRLFYRYTPYKDQYDLPIFDTALFDLSFGQLFRDNRFNGTDRVDDGHQTALALTSRLLGEETGREYLRTSIGQIYYFRDRKVTLPVELVEADVSSNVIAELATQFAEHWSSAVTMQWNPHANSTERSTWRLRYFPNSERIVNIAYRLRQLPENALGQGESLEQTDISWHWPLGTRWSTLGRWNYSLRNQKDLEIFAGLEYNSCCWAIRAIARRYLNSVDGNYFHGFFLQLELKGLGGVGKKAETFLEENISGYDDQF